MRGIKLSLVPRKFEMDYWIELGIMKGRWNDVHPEAIIGEGSDIWCWNYIGKAKIGRNVHITNWVHIGDGCIVGDECNFQPQVYLTSDTVVGNRVMFGRGSGTEDIKFIDISKDHPKAPVTIMDEAVIGARSEILGGITIGKRAVLGAYALATKDIPEEEVWIGIPAKYYCSRDEYDEKMRKYDADRGRTI